MEGEWIVGSRDPDHGYSMTQARVKEPTYFSGLPTILLQIWPFPPVGVNTAGSCVQEWATACLDTASRQRFSQVFQRRTSHSQRFLRCSISDEATAGSRQPRLRSRESVLVFDHCAWHRQLCVRPAPLAKLSVSFFLPAPLVPRHVEVSPSCASPPGCRDCTWNDWDLEVGLFPDVLLFCLMLFLSSPLLRGYDVTELGCSLATRSSKVPSWW